MVYSTPTQADTPDHDGLSEKYHENPPTSFSHYSVFQAASFQKKKISVPSALAPKNPAFSPEENAAVSPALSETLGAAMFAGPFLRAFRPGAAEFLLSGDFQVLVQTLGGC